MRNVRRSAPRRRRSLLLLPVLAAAAGAVAVAAETLRIESVWSAAAPDIDGKLADWPPPLVTLGQTPLSLGVRNDGQSLYVVFAASEQGTRMMLGAAGFTVWMDPAGKEKKSFGIGIPPTMAAGPGMRGRGPGAGPPLGQPGDAATPGQEGREGQREGGAGGQQGPAISTITSIEVLGPAKDDKRRFELAYARTIGLDAAARMAEGVLVYELRVPLSVSEAQPYGVRSAPGATIGLGIESGRLPRPEGRGGEGGRGGMTGGGGLTGGGGGQRGGMGGGPPGGGREGMRELKPIRVWMAVRLAKGPAERGHGCPGRYTGASPQGFVREVDVCACAGLLFPFCSCSLHSRLRQRLNRRPPGEPTQGRCPPSRRRRQA